MSYPTESGAGKASNNNNDTNNNNNNNSSSSRSGAVGGTETYDTLRSVRNLSQLNQRLNSGVFVGDNNNNSSTIRRRPVAEGGNTNQYSNTNDAKDQNRSRAHQRRQSSRRSREHRHRRRRHRDNDKDSDSASAHYSYDDDNGKGKGHHHHQQHHHAGSRAAASAAAGGGAGGGTVVAEMEFEDDVRLDSFGNIAYVSDFRQHQFGGAPGSNGGALPSILSGVPWDLRNEHGEFRENFCLYFSFLSTKAFWFLIQYAARVTFIAILVPAAIIHAQLPRTPFISGTFALTSVVIACGTTVGQSAFFFVQYLKAGCLWLPLATACVALRMDRYFGPWCVVYLVLLFLMAMFTEKTTRRMCLLLFNIAMVSLLSGNESLVYPSRMLIDWLLGAAFALAATLVPYPLLATRACRRISRKAFDNTATCFTGILECFWEPSNIRRSMSMVRVRHLVRTVDHYMDSFAAYDGFTYYEVLFFESEQRREVRREKARLLTNLKMNLRSMERVINMLQERPQMLNQSERCQLFQRHLSDPMAAITQATESLLFTIEKATTFADLQSMGATFEACGRTIKILQDEFDVARRILFYENQNVLREIEELNLQQQRQEEEEAAAQAAQAARRARERRRRQQQRKKKKKRQQRKRRQRREQRRKGAKGGRRRSSGAASSPSSDSYSSCSSSSSYDYSSDSGSSSGSASVTTSYYSDSDYSDDSVETAAHDGSGSGPQQQQQQQQQQMVEQQRRRHHHHSRRRERLSRVMSNGSFDNAFLDARNDKYQAISGQFQQQHHHHHHHRHQHHGAQSRRSTHHGSSSHKASNSNSNARSRAHQRAAETERMEEFVPLMTFFVFSIVNFWTTLREFQIKVEQHDARGGGIRATLYVVFRGIIDPFIDNYHFVIRLARDRAEPDLRVVLEAAKVSAAMLISVLFFYYVNNQSLLLSGPSIIAFVSGTNPVEATQASAARLSGTLIGSVLGFFAASLCHNNVDLVIALCFISFFMTFFRTGPKIGTVCMYCNFVAVSGLAPGAWAQTADSTLARVQQNTFAIFIYCFISVVVFPVSPNKALLTKRLAVLEGMSRVVTRLMGLMQEAALSYDDARVRAAATTNRVQSIHPPAGGGGGGGGGFGFGKSSTDCFYDTTKTVPPLLSEPTDTGDTDQHAANGGNASGLAGKQAGGKSAAGPNGTTSNSTNSQQQQQQQKQQKKSKGKSPSKEREGGDTVGATGFVDDGDVELCFGDNPESAAAAGSRTFNNASVFVGNNNSNTNNTNLMNSTFYYRTDNNAANATTSANNASALFTPAPIQNPAGAAGATHNYVLADLLSHTDLRTANSTVFPMRAGVATTGNGGSDNNNNNNANNGGDDSTLLMPHAFTMAPEDTTIDEIFADTFKLLDLMSSTTAIMPFASDEFTIVPAREYPLRASGEVHAALYRLCCLVYTMACSWKTMRDKGYFTLDVIHIFHNLAPVATDIATCLAHFVQIMVYYARQPSPGLSSELTKGLMKFKSLCIEFSARKEMALLVVIRQTVIQNRIVHTRRGGGGTAASNHNNNNYMGGGSDDGNSGSSNDGGGGGGGAAVAGGHSHKHRRKHERRKHGNPNRTGKGSGSTARSPLQPTSIANDDGSTPPDAGLGVWGGGGLTNDTRVFKEGAFTDLGGGGSGPNTNFIGTSGGSGGGGGDGGGGAGTAPGSALSPASRREGFSRVKTAPQLSNLFGAHHLPALEANWAGRHGSNSGGGGGGGAGDTSETTASGRAHSLQHYTSRDSVVSPVLSAGQASAFGPRLSSNGHMLSPGASTTNTHGNKEDRAERLRREVRLRRQYAERRRAREAELKRKYAASYSYGLCALSSGGDDLSNSRRVERRRDSRHDHHHHHHREEGSEKQEHQHRHHSRPHQHHSPPPPVHQRVKSGATAAADPHALALSEPYGSREGDLNAMAAEEEATAAAAIYADVGRDRNSRSNDKSSSRTKKPREAAAAGEADDASGNFSIKHSSDEDEGDEHRHDDETRRRQLEKASATAAADADAPLPRGASYESRGHRRQPQNGNASTSSYSSGSASGSFSSRSGSSFSSSSGSDSSSSSSSSSSSDGGGGDSNVSNSGGGGGSREPSSLIEYNDSFTTPVTVLDAEGLHSLTLTLEMFAKELRRVLFGMEEMLQSY